jgi:peptidoglycan/LPS O-acetylase OafA/YrhL
MMSRECAALSDLDFSSDDSSNSEEDEKPKRKIGDFTGLCLMGILMLLACLMVPDWNSESSKLILHCLVLAPLILCLYLIWRLLPLRLKILSTNLIILLATLSYHLHVKHVSLSWVSFSMLPKRTPIYNRRLLI